MPFDDFAHPLLRPLVRTRLLQDTVSDLQILIILHTIGILYLDDSQLLIPILLTPGFGKFLVCLLDGGDLLESVIFDPVRGVPQIMILLVPRQRRILIVRSEIALEYDGAVYQPKFVIVHRAIIARFIRYCTIPFDRKIFRFVVFVSRYRPSSKLVAIVAALY